MKKRDETAKGERIAHVLARAGVASRRAAEVLIAEGRVTRNNERVTHPATFVVASDELRVDGRAVTPAEPTRLWRYHKPPGLLTTARDPASRPTVFAALPRELGRVIAVGRLDLTSEGLLLLTNDGRLARHLELPATGWIRRYRARVYGEVDEAALRSLARGVEVAGMRYRPIEATLEAHRGTNAWLSVALHEGKNREIRRVLRSLGLEVNRLIRVSFGPFQLGNLPRGAVAEVPRKILREQLPRDLV